MLNKIAIIILCICGLPLILFGCLLLLGEKQLVNHTISNDNEILSSFNQTNEFIQSYIKSNHKPPTQSELNKWASQFPQKSHTPNGIMIITSNIPNDVIQNYGNPIGDYPFVLSYWRGEWIEYFISWKNQSTIISNNKKYYWSGYWIVDWLIPLSFGIFLLSITIRTYKSLNKRLKLTRGS